MRCDFCGRFLSIDPKSDQYDCGGTCLRCMAEGGDPECVEHLKEIEEPQKDS